MKIIFRSNIAAPAAGWTLLMPVSLACGSTPRPAPTIDANAVQTSIVERVSAQATGIVPTVTTFLTSTLAATEMIEPSSTPTVPVIPVTNLDAPGASCIPANPPQTGTVVDVVDGDTIKVLLNQDGQTYTVRYIGMDTPESTSQVEYFGAEASAKNSELVYGKTVTLIKDVSETDPYGRLLRYVIVDHFFVNYELVAQGSANTTSFPPDVACIPTFQEAEQKASAAQLGLWAAPPTLVVLPTIPAPMSSIAGGNAPCNCGGPDLDCCNFSSHASAQACHDYCVSQGLGDIFRLDGNDNDGLACESLP